GSFPGSAKSKSHTSSVGHGNCTSIHGTAAGVIPRPGGGRAVLGPAWARRCPMRRSSVVLGVVAVVLAGGFWAVHLLAAGQRTDAPAHHSAEMEKCIKECERCARECESCFNHCTMLVAQGHKEHVRTLKTCIDCGEFCAAAAKLTARHGAFMGLMC